MTAILIAIGLAILILCALIVLSAVIVGGRCDDDTG